jgi:hypothetical protein
VGRRVGAVSPGVQLLTGDIAPTPRRTERP